MPNMKICCLYSGSRGNSAYINAGGASILIDAGKSAKALCSVLGEIGVDISSIDAIFITHEHRDHISALQTLSHKHNIPIYILLSSAEVFYGLHDERLCQNLMLQMREPFSVNIKGLRVSSIRTSHDSRASVGYRMDFSENGENYAIGYVTDTGIVTDEMKEKLDGCLAVVMESNHDSDMLKNGPYPPELKQRIASRRGHLSNKVAAAFIAKLCNAGTKYVMLAHLSEENNLPEIAFDESFSAISDSGAVLKVAAQDEAVWLIGGED
ncbi:MAG: MBL fold metallo-hydrolase [Clostridia bacterium]|nr:MBL fold metallo-hydrolase [Clostridia bacterium]